MSVEPIDWTRVKAIFDAAVVLDVRARSAYVEDACGTDGQLRQQVAALLVSHDRAESFLETPAAALIAHAAELSGRTVGSYRIVSRLGAGGMGDVYRARDTKLGRDVAIKVLPEAFAGDSDRVARFEREAQLLAALNHPHIAAIYGLEQSGSTKFLVLELVEGESLADRLQAGALPVEEAVAVALQTADALQAAHDKGIIHRDLKPGNIMLTAEGQVKVLDFGLAKLESGWSGPPGRGGELTNSPTLAATRAGMILGTAAYMAPEQAKGRAADKRSDLWAFGCVLYELLTGRRAFEGEGVGDTLAAILRGEPDWKALPHGVPVNIRTILTGCLEKDRQKRLADMSVVQFLLTDARIGAPIDGRPGGLERRPSGLRVAGIAAVSALVAGIAAAAITWTLIRSEPTVTRLDVVTPPTDDPMSFALSPDGRQLVFVASVENVSRLWVRPLDDVTAQPLPDTDGASYPFWSPDGRALGFFADGKLKRLDVGGGVPQVLADAPSGRGGSWSRDGSIVFAPTVTGPLFRVSASGGPVAVLYEPDQSRFGGYRWPQVLPDGRRVLFWAGRNGSESPGVYLAQLDGSGIRRVMSANSAAAYAPGAYLLAVDQGTLLARTFDVERAEVGDPVAVAPSVAEDQTTYRGGFSVSATGVLAHRAAVAVRRQLVWVDRRGTRVGTIGPPDENGLINPALAPDGRRVIVQRTNAGQAGLWMLDSTRTMAAPFTFTFSAAPIWSPDGSRVLFGTGSARFDLYEKAASGAGTEHLVFSSADSKLPTDWSADGRLVLYQSVNEKTRLDVWALPLVGDRKPFPVVQTSFDERNGELAPDGRWIAYDSNQSGRFEVYVQRFPAPSGKWQISTGGGVTPRWSHDGREVFYLAPDGALMAVRVSLTSDGQALQPGAPSQLFRISIVPAGGNKHQFAVAPDNQRFLMNVRTDDAIASPITIVQNWTAGLKQ